MHENNMGGVLALLAVLAIARTAHAGVQISAARAEFRDSPRRVEIYFVLRNDTAHELELLKAESTLGEAVELKQRSYAADGTPRVWPVAKFEVPAGGSIHLQGIGRFFQVTGLAAGVSVGQRLPLTLTFEDEPPVTLELLIAAAAP